MCILIICSSDNFLLFVKVSLSCTAVCKYPLKYEWLKQGKSSLIIKTTTSSKKDILNNSMNCDLWNLPLYEFCLLSGIRRDLVSHPKRPDVYLQVTPVAFGSQLNDEIDENERFVLFCLLSLISNVN